MTKNYAKSGILGLGDMQRLMKLQKLLVKPCVRVMALHLKTLKDHIQNSENCSRPLYVIDMSSRWISLTNEVQCYTRYSIDCMWK
jgi:hypothetical protein